MRVLLLLLLLRLLLSLISAARAYRSGIVIQMLDEKMEPAVAKDILKGQTDPLNSSFHLGCVHRGGYGGPLMTCV